MWGKAMKKIGILMMIFSMFMMTGCSNENLVNDLFDNKKSDDIDVLWDVIDQYDGFIDNHYNTYAKKTYGNESIDTHDNYVSVNLEGIIYKNDLLNYELTDNRSYVEGSLSYTYLEISKHKDFVSDYCQNIKEGIQCDGDNPDEYFTYYVNDNQAYILYGQIVNEYLVYRHEMFFYTNEDEKKVFEYKVESISSDTYLPADHLFKSIVVENQGETYYTIWNFNDEDGNVGLKYIYHDFLDESWLSVSVNRLKMYQIKFFDPDKETYYEASVDSTSITLYNLEVYDGHILLVKMDPHRGYYKLNMMAIDGWDSISEIEDYDYPKNYEMNLEGLSIHDPMIVHLESRSGEYVYYEYNAFREEVPSDVLDLSRFGLESPYTLQFYLDEVDTFNSIYQGLIEEAHMDGSFETILASFEEALD